jgi:Flp pilus assembly protein TadD
MSGLAPFQELIEAGQYQQAIDKLGQALKEAPDDADLLNLIAYSHRISISTTMRLGIT